MFEVFISDKNGEYYFHLKAGNGEIILASEGYTQKHNAENGVDSVRTHAQSRENFKENRSVNEQYYFNLHASNYQIIGTSQMYTTKQAMENGIEAVMRVAPDAGLTDLS